MTGRKTAAWCSAAVVLLAAGCAGAGVGSGSGAGSSAAAGKTAGASTAAPPATGPAGGSGIWLQSVRMTSPATGWATFFGQPAGTSASNPELLARTTDTARTWADVTPRAARPLLGSAYSYAVMDPVDGSHAYLAVSKSAPGSAGKVNTAEVFATGDGGRTWTASSPFTTAGPVAQVTFTDARHGWLLLDVPGAAAGKPRPWLYRTTDGGRDWSPAATAAPPVGGGQNDMCQRLRLSFPTATTGWLVVSCRSGSYLTVSHDGGRTWAAQPLPIPAGMCTPPSGLCFIIGLEAVGSSAFLTVAPEGGAPSPVLLTTRDLGRTWHRLPLPPGAERYPQVTFSSPADGVLVPAAPQGVLGGVFYTTSDGGQTWTPAAQGTRFPQLGASIDFASPRDGISWTQAGDATGVSPPKAYATADAGRTWTPFTPRLTG